MSTQPTNLYAEELYHPRLGRRRMYGAIFFVVSLAFSLVAVIVLGALLYDIVQSGLSRLSWSLLTNTPNPLEPAKSGIHAALFGTLWLIGITALVSIPIGIGAAIFLEEYARKNWFARLIALNIANLAGVPSIVYGILGLAIFVYWLGMQRSVLAGGLALSLLIVPVIIIASREAISAVPRSVREAAYALGATRWQTIWHHVLPAALPGILTGVILSLSRAVGEAAPLIIIGAFTFVRLAPGEAYEGDVASLGGLLGWLRDALSSDFTALPLQIYSWSEASQPVFHELAAAAIVVLLAVLLLMNAAAIAIRAWGQRSH